MTSFIRAAGFSTSAAPYTPNVARLAPAATCEMLSARGGPVRAAAESVLAESVLAGGWKAVETASSTKADIGNLHRRHT
eukprot:1413750-Prymnesium_polylepis.2